MNWLRRCTPLNSCEVSQVNPLRPPAAFVSQPGRFSSFAHSALRSSSDMFVTTCPLFSHSSIPIWTMNMGDSQVQDCGGRACVCGQEVSADFTCLRVVRMCWCATTLLCWCDGCGRNTHGADDAESTVQCIHLGHAGDVVILLLKLRWRKLAAEMHFRWQRRLWARYSFL